MKRNTEKLVAALNLVGDKYIEEAETYKKITKAKKPKTTEPSTNHTKLFRIVASGALACMALAAFILPPIISGYNSVAETPSSTQTTTGSIGSIVPDLTLEERLLLLPTTTVLSDDKHDETVIVDPDTIPWEMRSATHKFPSVTILNTAYKGSSIINETYIGESLCLSTASGYDNLTDTAHTIEFEAFAIKKLDTDAAVAVKFTGIDGYKVYQNAAFSPQTLGEFESAYNFSEYFVACETYYKTEINGIVSDFRFFGLEKAKVWNTLFADSNAQMIRFNNENEEAKAIFAKEKLMTCGLSFYALGFSYLPLEILEDGYCTIGFNTRMAFYVGEEKTQELINFVLYELDGMRIVRVTDTTKPTTSVTLE